MEVKLIPLTADDREQFILDDYFGAIAPVPLVR